MERDVDDWERVLRDLVLGRGAALKGYAYLLCGNSTEADDLVQAALLRTFSRRPGVQLGQVETYVRRAILNLFLDSTRRQRRWQLATAREASCEPAEDHASGVVRQRDVHLALMTLSPRQRACVVLRYYGDLPVVVIARELRCGEGAVKRYLHEGRSRLAEALPGYDLEATSDGL